MLKFLLVTVIISIVGANRWDVPYWPYEGCFDLAATEKMFESDNMSAKLCQSYCSKDFKYSIVQNNKCMCSNQQVGDKVNAKKFEFCLKGESFSVFKNSDYLGCFVDIDEPEMLDMKDYIESDFENMTTEKCLGICRKEGYKYAGTQYYGHCQCAHDFGRYGEAPRKACGTPCAGNYLQMCGGSHANSVYRIDY